MNKTDRQLRGHFTLQETVWIVFRKKNLTCIFSNATLNEASRWCFYF